MPAKETPGTVRRLLPLAIAAALGGGGALAAVGTRPHPSMILPWDAPLSFGSHDVGGARSDASAEILHPAGPPPYPVVMVLSGCAGITDNERDRAIRLASWVSPPS
jgi:hypothetical protein